MVHGSRAVRHGIRGVCADFGRGCVRQVPIHFIASCMQRHSTGFNIPRHRQKGMRGVPIHKLHNQKQGAGQPLLPHLSHLRVLSPKYPNPACKLSRVLVCTPHAPRLRYPIRHCAPPPSSAPTRRNGPETTQKPSQDPQTTCLHPAPTRLHVQHRACRLQPRTLLLSCNLLVQSLLALAVLQLPGRRTFFRAGCMKARQEQ